MKTSVLSTTRVYFSSISAGVRSLVQACSSILPYLWSATELRKEVTEQYPDPVSSRTPDELPSRTRGLLENDIQRCTGCKECEEVCPVKCIKVENEPGEDPGKTWVAVFDIDHASCIFCGLCVEVCAPQSLIHTREYEGAALALPQLVTSFGRGRVTDEQREKWDIMRRSQEAENL